MHVYRRRQEWQVPAGSGAVVSLHSHSSCSREKLDFAPVLARQIPLVASIFGAKVAKYQREHGSPLDFDAIYWRPPLTPAAVIESERTHIALRFERDALVSLTDHDTLDGPRSLRAAGRADVPLSVEWSVPFGGTMFHLGVHAIAQRAVDEAERAMAAFTSELRGDPGALLDWLCEWPETFVVLNHPYWDLVNLGAERHESILLDFLKLHRRRIHGLELNGYRSWRENRRVIPLGETFGLPLVGGGDRHGYAPNTIVNPTAATSLAEFAYELRHTKRTTCVVLPEYQEPYTARVLHTAAHVVRPDARHRLGRSRWTDNVFMTVDGVERSVASVMGESPWWVPVLSAATRALGSPALWPVLRVLCADGLDLLDADAPATAGPRTTARAASPRLAHRSRLPSGSCG